MTLDTNVETLIINRLTKQQYDAIAEKDPTQLYILTDVDASETIEETRNALNTLVQQANQHATKEELATLAAEIAANSNNETPIITITQKAGSISLETNKVYSLSSPTGSLTFNLPSTVNVDVFNQILVQLHMPTVQSINAGTTSFFNEETLDLSNAGVYDLIWEYDKFNGCWVFGAILKTIVKCDTGVPSDEGAVWNDNPNPDPDIPIIPSNQPGNVNAEVVGGETGNGGVDHGISIGGVNATGANTNSNSDENT